MYFKRKAYDKLVQWKTDYAQNYAVLLEGARRVGKSTIAEQLDRKSTRLNSSHPLSSRMPSSA